MHSKNMAFLFMFGKIYKGKSLSILDGGFGNDFFELFRKIWYFVSVYDKIYKMAILENLIKSRYDKN